MGNFGSMCNIIIKKKTGNKMKICGMLCTGNNYIPFLLFPERKLEGKVRNREYSQQFMMRSSHNFMLHNYFFMNICDNIDLI